MAKANVVEVESFQPHPKQKLFLESQEDVIMFGGAAGGGKSRGLLEDALVRCIYVPNYAATIFRRTSKELEKTHVKWSNEIFPPNICDYNKQDKTWKFWNGSTLEFNHCQYDSDVERYQSASYDYIGIDEATHWTEYMFKYLLSRNRMSHPLMKIRPAFRMTTNPGSIGHGWVKHIFLDGGCPCAEHQSGRLPGTRFLKTFILPNKRKVTKSYKFIQAFLEDNPSLDENDPSYRANLMEQPEHIRKALLDGCWEIFAGQAFPDWRPTIDGLPYHVIPASSFQLDYDTMNMWRAIDWGHSKPFWCGWFAIDEYGRVTLYRDVMRAGLKDDEQARLIQSMTGPTEEKKIMLNIGDRSMWGKGRGHNEWLVTSAAAYYNMNIPLFKSISDRIPGRLTLHRWLTEAPDGKPWFQVTDNCRSFINCIPKLINDPNNPEDVKEGGDDHAYDGIRYGLTAVPGVPMATKAGRNPNCLEALCEDQETRDRMAGMSIRVNN